MSYYKKLYLLLIIISTCLLSEDDLEVSFPLKLKEGVNYVSIPVEYDGSLPISHFISIEDSEMIEYWCPLAGWISYAPYSGRFPSVYDDMILKITSATERTVWIRGIPKESISCNIYADPTHDYNLIGSAFGPINISDATEFSGYCIRLGEPGIFWPEPDFIPPGQVLFVTPCDETVNRVFNLCACSSGEMLWDYTYPDRFGAINKNLNIMQDHDQNITLIDTYNDGGFVKHRLTSLNNDYVVSDEVIDPSMTWRDDYFSCLASSHQLLELQKSHSLYFTGSYYISKTNTTGDSYEILYLGTPYSRPKVSNLVSPCDAKLYFHWQSEFSDYSSASHSCLLSLTESDFSSGSPSMHAYEESDWTFLGDPVISSDGLIFSIVYQNDDVGSGYHMKLKAFSDDGSELSLEDESASINSI